MTEVLGGRFRLLELAGSGAGGDVFRAVDEVTEQHVAVKRLTGLDDELAETRFLREARLLETIDHPHVVKYIGQGRDDRGAPFVAVAWLEGQDLRRRHRVRRLDERQIVDVVRQAASGLEALHAIGVVHRDVKPSNVFLTERPDGSLHVTVIDLGIAHEGAQPALTLRGMMVGTPSYMSPEQILGNAALTPRTDVFSLGVMIFELVAGVKPYRGEDTMAIVAKIALLAPPKLSEVLPNVSEELDRVVATAMRKSPSERFTSVSELAEALAGVRSFISSDVTATSLGEITRAVSSRPPSGSMTAGEKRVMTAIFARFASKEAARAAKADFERIAGDHGGATSTILERSHVAIFGSVRSTGDEARRAARAALAIRRASVEGEIAVVTGRALAGLERLSDDAIERGAGAAVPATRHPARLDAVPVDQATYRLLGDAFEVEADGDRRWVMGETEPRTTEPTLLGKKTPFLGREVDLSRLEALYDDVVKSKRARAAVVIGGAGAGKSRLRFELVSRLARRGERPTVLFGRSSIVEEGAAFALVGSAIRGYARVRENEPPLVRAEKLAATLSGPAKLDLAPFLAQLAGGSGDTAGDDRVLVGDRLRDAFVRWLTGLAASGPVILLLEDLERADAASISLVGAALASASHSPIMVLALSRPEIERRFPLLWADQDPLPIHLAKLSREACEGLVRFVLGEVDQETMAALVDRADGNAFFLEELVRAWASRPAVARAGDIFELPDTVLGIVQARLDAVGQEAKQVLKAASIFGEATWEGAIDRVLGEDGARSSLGYFLGELTDREILVARPASRFDHEPEYAFRHALLRDAAYALFADDDRARAHLAAAEWLEQNGEPDALSLARHFDAGHAPERALPHYRRAAEQALFGSDFHEAQACAERALACGPRNDVEGGLLLIVAEAKRWAGDLAGALDAAVRSMELSPAGSRAWFSALRERVAALGRLGSLGLVGPLAELGVSTRAAEGAASAKVAALVPAAVHLLYAGERKKAEAVALAVESFAQRERNMEPRVLGRVHQLRAALATHDEDTEAGIFEQEQAKKQFERAGDRRAGALVRANLAFALLQVGEIERAETTLREALEIANELGLGTIAPLIEQNLGVTLGHQGMTTEAIELHQRAAGRFEKVGDPRLEGSSRLHLAFLFEAQRDLVRAEAEARRALALGIDVLEVGARAALSHIALARGDVAVATLEAESGMEALERIGRVEEFEITLRLALAVALRRSGNTERAVVEVLKAVRRVEDRRDRIRDESLRESMVERIPEHAAAFALAAELGAR